MYELIGLYHMSIEYAWFMSLKLILDNYWFYTTKLNVQNVWTKANTRITICIKKHNS